MLLLLLLLSLFQSGNYGPPGGFCFDQFCSDPPMQTDPRLEDVNTKERVDAFVAAAMDNYKNAMPSNHIMLKMGSDFQCVVCVCVSVCLCVCVCVCVSGSTRVVPFTLLSPRRYENANEWFKNLDKLMAAANAGTYCACVFCCFGRPPRVGLTPRLPVSRRPH